MCAAFACSISLNVFARQPPPVRVSESQDCAINSNPTPRLVRVTRLGRSMTDARALVSSCAPSVSRDSLVARGSALFFTRRRSSRLARSACPRLSRGRVSVPSRSGARLHRRGIGEVDRLRRRMRPLASRARVFDVDGDAERCWEYVCASSLASSWARARRGCDSDVRRRRLTRQERHRSGRGN